MELAAINPAVQEALRPDRAGWDAVVFDEAHRLTPTAETFHRAGSLLAKNNARALFMTATPHRGNEWLFRHLLHLVDPEVYPEPGSDNDAPLRPVRPGPVHFLRRMKEDLVDYDGATPLFKGRRAQNVMVPLNGVEDAFYREASRAATAERRAIADVLNRLDPLLVGDHLPVSKWRPLVDECFVANGIQPGNGQQAVVFTEYADSANWIVDRLRGVQSPSRIRAYPSAVAASAS